MKVKPIALTGKAAAELELNPAIFGTDVRADVLARVVEWQLARRRAGTHKVKSRGEVSGTTKKPFSQKGTGNARQGSRVGPHMRGGSVAHGPCVRSHAIELPKKFRKLGLKMALSEKAKEGKLSIVDDIALKSPKTKDALSILEKLKVNSVLFISGENVDAAFAKAIRNIHQVDALPQIGANVYDILRHDDVVLTLDAVKQLEERLS